MACIRDDKLHQKYTQNYYVSSYMISYLTILYLSVELKFKDNKNNSFLKMIK